MTSLDELHAAEAAIAGKIDALVAAYASAKDLAAHPVVVAAAATDADLQAMVDKLNADGAKVDAALAPAATSPEPVASAEPDPSAPAA